MRKAFSITIHHVQLIIMNNSEIILYQNPDGNIKIDVRLEEETVWLTQAQMAELFGKGRTTITEHIQNVFKEGELDENSVCRKFRQVRNEGSREVEREIEKGNNNSGMSGIPTYHLIRCG